MTALTIAVMTACASVQTPDLKPDLPSQWRNATPAEGGAATPDLRGWWHAFGDSRLDALVDEALKTNLDLQQAAERIRAARLLARHSGDRFLPNLHARTNDAIDPDASASFFIAGFDSTWELGLFGAHKGAKRVAEGDLENAEASLQGARVSLVAEVVRQWIQLRAAQQQEAVLQRTVDAQAEQLRLLEVRQGLRLASTQDVAQARVAQAQARATLADPRKAINASAQQLALLLGRSEPDAAWLEGGDLPQLGELRVATAPADLVRTRPEIVAAEANVLRSAGELGLTRAQMYPNLQIGAAMQWSTDITSYRHTRSRGIVSLGPIIDIPLFDWGNRVAAAHAKGYELKAAVLAYRQAVLQGVAEAETAMGDLQQSSEREQASIEAVTALRQGADALQTRVGLKLASPLDARQSQIESDHGELALLQARVERDLAYVSLYKALGGAPLPPHPAEGEH